MLACFIISALAFASATPVQMVELLPGEKMLHVQQSKISNEATLQNAAVKRPRTELYLHNNLDCRVEFHINYFGLCDGDSGTIDAHGQWSVGAGACLVIQYV